MGGHGGLNILPQKKWNVYNPDNREKVAKDERQKREREIEEEKRDHDEAAQRRYDMLRRKNHQNISDSHKLKKDSSTINK